MTATASEREILGSLASAGDAAAIAEYLLTEDRVCRLDDTIPVDPDAVMGRTEDLLGQRVGDEATFIGWVAALANGVTRTGGIESWSRQAVSDALVDRSNPTVMWSEIRRGDLVIGASEGSLRTAVSLDGTWAAHLGATHLERVALVDLFGVIDPADATAGPKVLKDKLWFWASYGAPENMLREDPDRTVEFGGLKTPQPGSAALWLAAAAMLCIVTLLFGLVVVGGNSRSGRLPTARLESLFPTSELERLAGTTVDEPLQLCNGGAPDGSFSGEYSEILMDRLDVYYFDEDTVMVEVAFVVPLDLTLEEVSRRLVRGYRVDPDGHPVGAVSSVEVVAGGSEARGQYDLTGRSLPGGAERVAVDDTFQFYLDLDLDLGLDEASSGSALRLGVDSMGDAGAGSGDLVCQIVVTDAIRFPSTLR